MKDKIPADWGKLARSVFWVTYRHIRDNQGLMLHADAQKVIPEWWNTTAWNTAWTAADILQRQIEGL